MYTVSVLAVPNASKTEIVGWHDGALKIRLAAPPVDGKANEELIRFLADYFDLSRSEITIGKGATGKRKRVTLPLTKEDIDLLLLRR